jgi:hypothetical protein
MDNPGAAAIRLGRSGAADAGRGKFRLDSTGIISRQLPAAILWAATALLTVVLIFVLRRGQSRAERFAIFAIWARFVMSAHHDITFKPLVAGLSMNAVGSISIIGLGLLMLNIRHGLTRFFIPPAIVLLVMVVSGLVNGSVGDIISGATKLGYFAIVTVAVFDALATSNEKGVMSNLLWAFSPLLLFQVLSLATGTVKAGESDGSVSYIGGYHHEAAFSTGLAGCLLVACVVALNRRWLGNILVFASVVGIYLANYRTTILASTPLLFVNFALPRLMLVTPRQRNLIRYAAFVFAALTVIILAMNFQDRFSDLLAVLGDKRPIIRDPMTFSFEERRYLSGRPYLWSTYYWAWKDGTPVNHLLGFGPTASEGAFHIHPHNTLMLTLYDMGLLGVGAILFWWGALALYALRAAPSRRAVLLAGHMSFFLINMATSPLWMIEGNIFYGILCGLTLYHWRLAQRADARAGARSPALWNGTRKAAAPAPAGSVSAVAARRHRPEESMP